MDYSNTTPDDEIELNLLDGLQVIMDKRYKQGPQTAKDANGKALLIPMQSCAARALAAILSSALTAFSLSKNVATVKGGYKKFIDDIDVPHKTQCYRYNIHSGRVKACTWIFGDKSHLEYRWDVRNGATFITRNG